MAEKQSELSWVKKFHNEFSKAVSDKELTIEELQLLREEYDKTKNDIVTNVKKDIEAFFKSTSKTMLTWWGFQILNPEKDFTFLESIWYSKKSVDSMRNLYKNNWNKWVIYDDEWILYFASSKWNLWQWMFTRTWIIELNKDSLLNLNAGLEVEMDIQRLWKIPTDKTSEPPKNENDNNTKIKPKRKSKKSRGAGVERAPKEDQWIWSQVKENPKNNEIWILTWNNVILRDENNNSIWLQVNKWDKVILSWDVKEFSKWLYYWVKMQDNSIKYIHSKYINIEKTKVPEINQNAQIQILESLHKIKWLENVTDLLKLWFTVNNKNEIVPPEWLKFVTIWSLDDYRLELTSWYEVKDWEIRKIQIKFKEWNSELAKILLNKWEYPEKTSKELNLYTWKATQRGINNDWVEYIFQWEIAKGKRDGKWIMIWADWDKYEWDWKDNYRNGKWIMVWADWDKYEWDFIDGKFNGKWIYTYADWTKYEWDWKDDKRSGKWKRTWANWDYSDLADYKNGSQISWNRIDSSWKIVREYFDGYNIDPIEWLIWVKIKDENKKYSIWELEIIFDKDWKSEFNYNWQIYNLFKLADKHRNTIFKADKKFS